MFLCFMCKCKRWCFDDYQRRRCVCLPLFIAARLPSRSILGARWRSHLLKAPCVPHIVCLCGRKTQCDHNYTHQWNIIIFIILRLCVHKTQCAHDYTHRWKLRSFATSNIRHGKHPLGLSCSFQEVRCKSQKCKKVFLYGTLNVILKQVLQ